jgi:subtilisin family serine protease
MRRRMKVAVMVGVLVLIAVIGGGPSTAAADDGRRLLDVQCDILMAVQQTVSLIPGVKVLHVLPFICALGVQLNLGSLDALVQTLLGTLGVVAIYNDPLSALTLVDPISSETPPPEDYDWPMDQILVPDVQQAYGLQGSGVTVAIVDSGVDTSHPEFTKRITGGFNAVADEGGGCNGGANAGNYKDNHGHGTHMAGIIAAAVNGQGVVGAAPQVNIMAVKVLNKKAQGHLSDFICGLQWVHDHNVRVVNMSMVFWNDKPLLKRAIQNLYGQGALMVAAAGNHSTSSDPSCVSGFESGGGDSGGGDGQPEEISCDTSSFDVMYPAKYQSWVIGVAATKYNDKPNPKVTQITYYSRYGPEIVVAAPGGELKGRRILSTRPGSGLPSYGEGSGTSQATACVTGVVILGVDNTPDLTFEQARNALQATAWDLGYSGLLASVKLINALEFVESLP